MTKVIPIKKPAKQGLQKAGVEQLESLKDIHLAERVVVRILSGKEKVHSLEQVETQLDLMP